MATPEEMANIVRISVEQAVGAAMTQFSQLFQQQTSAQSSPSDSRGKVGDLLEKLAKRTTIFDGQGFQEWKFKTEISMRAINPQLKDLTHAATQQTDEIDPDLYFTGDLEQFRELDNTLYYFLVLSNDLSYFLILPNESLLLSNTLVVWF